jgi:hypothetical protein
VPQEFCALSNITFVQEIAAIYTVCLENVNAIENVGLYFGVLLFGSDDSNIE